MSKRRPTPPDSYTVLLIGGGGREHALAWKLRQSPRVKALYATHTQNAGIASLSQPIDHAHSMRELYRLELFCERAGVNLVVVGPEAPLAEGIAEKLTTPGRVVFGPGRQAAQLEADKAWAKQIMRAAAVPTAESRVFKHPEEAKRYLETREEAPVIKATGLAAGKGVYLPDTLEEAIKAIDEIMVQRRFGDAGAQVLLEERLSGPEASVLALVDGRSILVLDQAQDHKRIGEGDTGPNTGGMGAYCPAHVLTDEQMTRVEREVFLPIVDTLRRDDIEYRGILYAGLMLTPAGPKVLEFNVRFGDPECQALLPRMKCDFAELCWRTATGTLDECELSFDPRHACCVVLAQHGYPGESKKGAAITGVDEVERAGVHVFHASTTRSPSGELLSGGGRVLSVVAMGDTLEQARERANAAAATIRFEGKVYRRDIGAKALVTH
ncbi:MAG: phosphoribosylamine--glycine ligase [Phycisphaeraceae bacterium]|nr:phosphoribosylamine--glycine ligase [Phycisphaeraceae bacterium]